jgi:hypothetical protein
MIKALGVFMEGKSSTGDRPAASGSPHEKQSPVSDASSTRPDPVTSIHLANSQKKLDIPPSHALVFGILDQRSLAKWGTIFARSSTLEFCARTGEGTYLDAVLKVI